MVKNIFTVLVESNIWMSLGVALLVLPSAHMMSIPFDWRIPVLGFFVSMIVYTWDHRLDVINGEKTTTAIFDKFYRGRLSQIIITISFICAVIMMMLSPLIVTFGAFIIIFAGIIYSRHLIPGRDGRKYRIKDIRFLKTWFTPFICALGIVVSPIVFSANIAGIKANDVWFTFLYFFIMTSCNTSSFDIRDLDSDNKYAVQTLPTIINVRNTLRILQIINIAMAIVMLFVWYVNICAPHPEMLVWIIGNAVYLSTITLQTPKLFFDIVVDGTLYLPTLALLFVKLFNWH